MSEGSSLSARESLTALGAAGFRTEVADRNPLCLARFSKWCARIHQCPKFGTDPEGYLDFVMGLLAREAFDVLYPAHEQAYLFAKHRNSLMERTHLALPPFEVFERMQSKVGFARVLAELGLPAAPTTIVHDERALDRVTEQLPVYIKAAFGTATQATFSVQTPQERTRAINAMREVLAEGVVVQAPLEGRLGRTQAVFASGRLVGFHACMQVEAGVSGGDFVKESIEAPLVREHVAHLGRRLGWHGGLSLDFIMAPDGEPRYIDSNPRLAETGNALAAGVNLPELLAEVSLGREPSGCLVGRPGIRTFMGIQGLLQAAEKSGSRRSVARAILGLTRHRGRFAGGSEELTPSQNDLCALLPVVLTSAALLVNPKMARTFSSFTVDAYAATPQVVRFVRSNTRL
jgi:predicted ATP-grasp superfamily ATP-dependent carboligase